MNGTNFSVTAETRFTPPNITAAEIAVITTPVKKGDIPKTLSMFSAIVLAWVRLPIPNEASTEKAANAAAETFAIGLYFIPCFR